MPAATDQVATLMLSGVSVATEDGQQTLVKDVSLSARTHECVGVVGESGAGKSLVVRTILQLLPPELTATGHVRFEGKELSGLPDEELRVLRGSGIAAILPNPRSLLNPVIPIGTIMAAAMRAHATVTKDEVRERSIELLQSVGIQDAVRRLDAYPHELSGGMAQRICIALALMHEPRLVVADEPTAGLDVTVQRQVLDLMQSLVTERGSAQIIVTRDLGIAAHYCDHVIVMRKGAIVESGSPSQIFHSPTHSYTRSLLADNQPMSSTASTSIGGRGES